MAFAPQTVKKETEHSMPDIFQDVDDALRRERVEQFWHAHAGLIVAAIAALILGTGAYSFWKSWSESRAQEQTSAFLAAQQTEGDASAQLRTFAEETPSGALGALALLTAAGKLADSGNTEEARKAYESLAQGSAADSFLRDYAILMAARLGPAGAEGANKDLAALDAVIAKKDSPWSAMARIVAATLSADALGDIARARGYLAPLLDSAQNREQGAPMSLLMTARQLDDVYALKETPAQSVP